MQYFFKGTELFLSLDTVVPGHLENCYTYLHLYSNRTGPFCIASSDAILNKLLGLLQGCMKWAESILVQQQS